MSFLLFGPEATQWTEESLSGVQSALQENTKLTFLRETLANLPSLWATLGKHYKPFGLVGQDKIQQLSDFAAGKSSLDPKSLCNIHLAPLTAAAHLIDFVRMSNELESEVDKPSLPSFRAAQGFCIGFLSAAAVSSSSDWADFERNASNAVRLAACIGAIIDIEDASKDADDQTTAISVRWKTDSDRSHMWATLDVFPDAYVSCTTDEKSITVTVPTRDASSFCSRLSKAKVASKPIGLYGSFHHSRHNETLKALTKLCAANQELQLPSAEKLRFPLRSTTDGELITSGALSDVALDLILCKRAHWFQTVKETLRELPEGEEVKFVHFGKDFQEPRSLCSRKTNSMTGATNGESVEGSNKPEEIAIIGMTCRFPEADTLEDFWNLISSGETTIREVPEERFTQAHVNRTPNKTKLWGNFIQNPDAFDHRFFGISGREAKSMDPQQRLALQTAYEALESSGYCSLSSEKQAKDIGCYLGVGSVDYEDNVASENANAFSATGTLRAFISGRISHYFGWTGPSITFDTACSSSAVAIHSACQALLTGDCSMALAGGVNIITSPNLHQNLAAASFLNPDGSSKAFDAAANGYCRGEGSGIMVMKPLSKAVADGDMVLGVIAGSAVNQGSNCSPITVPDSDSQSTLYKQALSKGNIDPKDVTYVEAHGTGTPVGDPIEYASVQSTFTDPSRTEELFLGSVKSNIGHAEGASGAAGVIKSLLMMQHQTIPKQANFKDLNPRIKTSAGDRITVPKETQPWSTQKRVALINNYGAAGSNAAIVVREHVKSSGSSQASNGAQSRPSGESYPIVLSAKSASNLRSYMIALQSYLPNSENSLGNVAYNIARRQNSGFETRTAFTASDTANLVSTLEKAIAETDKLTTCSDKLPAVLCFGGQNSSTVTLSKELYDGSRLLQTYLDECNVTCEALGIPSLFPGIFEKDPIEDPVSLHTKLFALQYSSAKCWLDSGLEVDTLVGHSFGQLTALCVADSISLKDALFLISGRARLIQERWGEKCGEEKGVMLSVESDLDDIQTVVDSVNSEDGSQVDFACYNGPRSIVVAGDESSIAKVEEACSSADSETRFKAMRLKNSHAYHSYLADSILPGLESLAKSMEIRKPRIRVETCSKDGNWSEFTAEEISQHTRRPVYFFDALERITTRLPAAIWVEAGSASPVIAMARRALPSTAKSDNVFVPLDLGTSDATSNLANAICQLWKAGSSAQYWHFHRSQQIDYTNLNLPPYQFEKAQHWIEYKHKSETESEKSNEGSNVKENKLVNLLKNDNSGKALFSVATSNVVFDLAARGHAVAGQSLCPASMYIELAARCVSDILGETSEKLPQVEQLTMCSPLGLDPNNNVFLRISKTSDGAWDFVVFSNSHKRDGDTEHAHGRISLTPMDDPVSASRMKLLKRLAKTSRPDQITLSPLAAGISGSMVYDTFMDVVDYASYYRGVESVYGLENESVGFVNVPTDQILSMDPGVCDPISLDNFLQVAGIHVNCLSERKSDTVFMCTDVEEVIFTEGFIQNRANTRSWTVYSRYETTSKNNIANDIFVFDADTKDLVLTVMGAKFKGVPFSSVTKSLAKLNTDAVKTVKQSSGKKSSNRQSGGRQSRASDDEDSGYQSGASSPSETDKKSSSMDNTPAETPAREASPAKRESKSNEVVQQVREMFSNIIEIPLDEVEPTSKIEDLGIDSLLVTEVVSEIEERFKVSVAQEEFLEFEDVLSVCRRIQPDGVDDDSQPSTTKPAKETTETETKDESASEAGDEATSEEDVDEKNFAVVSRDSFADIKGTYDEHAKTTKFSNFCADVFPLQSELVVQYVSEAFASLNCDLRAMKAGDEVPTIEHIPKHKKLIPQLYKILESAGLVKKEGGAFWRTDAAVPERPSSDSHTAMLEKFPQHASETKLLHTTAPRLADCLSGKADPLALIFKDATARTLLEDVYTNAPMFKAGTLILAQYLSEVLENFGGDREIKILELGAGTGGTTKSILEKLSGSEHKFTYTFTDLSSSLVATAKRKFSKYPFMEYTVLDIEKDPGALSGTYDIIISTNCIHATKDLVLSTTNIRKMLRPEGILCLVELTRNLFWFDLVFGLLEGWWLFNDGREHVLASESRWDRCLHDAGFNWVNWSDSASEESDILRVITASPAEVAQSVDSSAHVDNAPNDDQPLQETVTFKEVDGLSLEADIYYPETTDSNKSLPVALMIHGGGHVMLSRKDVRPEQTRMLLKSGFLPVSIDYRLCPETTLQEGPMEDVADALAWTRNVLPKLPLKRRGVRVDGEKVVSVGWSTGGHLAMSLAWTSEDKGVRAPDATLAFYCPLDYEDPFWTKPNIPDGSQTAAAKQSAKGFDKSICDGLYDKPIVGYNVPSNKLARGGWLSTSDPRSRIALYMNWQGRALNVLLNGLDKQNPVEPSAPTSQQVKSVSPLANIRSGGYKTPTFIVHPRKDDLIPWEQAQRTFEALRDNGIDTDLRIIEDVPHLFDVYRGYEKNEGAIGAVKDGYEYLCGHVGLCLKE